MEIFFCITFAAYAISRIAYDIWINSRLTALEERIRK